MARNKFSAWAGQYISGQHIVALADQLVVSGTSFLTTILIARFSDSSQLGLYAIVVSILVTLMAIQEALILLPYVIQRHEPIGTPAEHAGASIAASAILSAVSVPILIAGAVVAYGLGSSRDSLTIAAALVCVVPFALMREFVRQFSFAHMKFAQVLALDCLVAAVQLTLLGVLGLSGHLSGASACATLLATYALAFLTWLILARAELVIRVKGLWPYIAKSWMLGKWLLAGQITVQTQAYITYWLTIAISGASTTGVYAACMSIIAFANPVIFGLANLLTPKSVLAWRSHGGAGLLKRTVRDTLLLGTLIGLFAVAVIVFGPNLMHLLYRGEQFHGYAHVLSVLAIGCTVTAVGIPATIALTAMERGRALATVQVLGAATTVALVASLLPQWGLIGAAYGALGGGLVGTVSRWVALLALVPRVSNAGAVTDVLRQYDEKAESENWTIARLG